MQKAYTRYLDHNPPYPIDIEEPIGRPDMIVVIPCYKEPNICDSLDALFHASTDEINVLILVVLNHSLGDEEGLAANLQSYNEMMAWRKDRPVHCSLGIIKAFDLPLKTAGVGLARKIGMDTACHIFGIDHLETGIIACYDADSLCETTYISAVYHAFEATNIDAVSIYYEHPIEGSDYPDFNYKAIVQYETHLRYFIHEQRRLHLPFAFQTVGSSMAVRASSYCKFGGMNRRKAGEDFYFMHRFIENGKVVDLLNTKVIPSPRISDRVPFGTGKAVGDMHSHLTEPEFLTYDPRSFRLLDGFVEQMRAIFHDQDYSYLESMDGPMIDFFRQMHLRAVLEQCIDQSTSLAVFEQRLYRKFNAFQLMEFLHFIRDHQYPLISVQTACDLVYGSKSIKDHLLYLRQIDRTTVYPFLP